MTQRLIFRLEAWCAHCSRFRPATTGPDPDPAYPARLTEVLDPHRARFPRLWRRCPGSLTDANPVDPA